MDKFLNVMIGLFVVVCIWAIFYALPRDIERTDRAKEIAQSMGCEYIGSARDLSSVKFLDCNGEVKAIRVK